MNVKQAKTKIAQALAILNEVQESLSDNTLKPHLGISTTNVPSLLDNQYQYNCNGTSNLVTFKKGDELHQVFAYWNEHRRLTLTERKFPEGEWGNPIDIHQAIGGDELEFDSHNYIAFGVAHDGTMFVTGNHHVDPLRMAVTERPYDISSFKRFDNKRMARGDTQRVTYPSFTYLKNKIFFSYREQEVAGRGRSEFRWLLKEWNPSAKTWVDAAEFNTTNKLRLYVSHIFHTKKRHQLHLVGLWRDDRNTNVSYRKRHHDLFHMWSSDGFTWRQRGVANPVDLPLSWKGHDITRGAKNLIWDSASDPNPLTTGKMVTVGDNNTPHIVSADVGGNLWHHTFGAAGGWVSSKLGLRAGWPSTDIFELPGGRVGFLWTEKEHLFFSEIREGKLLKHRVLSKGWTGGSFTLNIDKTALEHGYVSALLTDSKHSLHSDPKRPREPLPRPATILTCSIEHLDSII